MAELINCRCEQDGAWFLVHIDCPVHGKLSYNLLKLGAADIARVTELAAKLVKLRAEEAAKLEALRAEEAESDWQAEFAQAMQGAGDALRRGIEGWTKRVEQQARERGLL